MFSILKRSIGPLAIALAATTGTASAQAPSPYGVWLDQAGKGAVEITDCNGRLCGRVVWVRDAKDKAGCNLQILGDVRPVASNRWDNGWIIDPDRGTNQRFDVEITLLNANRLKVTGYAGVKFLSETVTWSRAQPDLPRCTEAAAAKPDSTVATAPPPPADSPAGTAPTPAQQAPVPVPGPQAEAPPPAPAPVPVPDSSPRGSQGSNGKVARGGQKECRLDLPYVGKITFPCDE